MQTNPPKFIVWLIAVILGALGIVGTLVAIPVVSAYAFWLLTIGFIVLALSTVLKGM
jgi:heme/copper-type cytochrome/quinol oxidase subunit 1